MLREAERTSGDEWRRRESNPRGIPPVMPDVAKRETPARRAYRSSRYVALLAEETASLRAPQPAKLVRNVPLNEPVAEMV
jgi:hypothetical protein